MRAWVSLIALLISLPALAQLTNPTVSGPASSTVNAFSLWGDTTGDALINTRLLLDTSLLTTNRTLQWPDFSGKPLVNNVGDTLQNTLIDDNVTFFAHASATRQLNFFLGGVAAGDTISFNMPSDSSGLTPGARSIIIPGFSTGQTSITLLTNSGAQVVSGWEVDGAKTTNWFEYQDICGGGITPKPSPDSSFFGIRLYDWCEQLDFTNTNGNTIHVSSYTTVEVDFGSSPLTEKSFTITDAEIAASNAGYSGTPYFIEVFIPRATTTGKTYIDENDMDSFYVACTPGAGNLICMVRCLTGQYRGTLKLNYRMTQQNE